MNDGKCVLPMIGVINDTKITDWKPRIDEHKLRMEIAKDLRDEAEMVLGYCLIDSTRSAMTRNRLRKLTEQAARRAAMTPEERATIDLVKARASSEIQIMREQDLTFGQMRTVANAIP